MSKENVLEVCRMNNESIKNAKVNNVFQRIIFVFKNIFGHGVTMLPEATVELDEEQRQVFEKAEFLTNDDSFESLKEIYDLYQITTNSEGKTVASDKKTGYVIENEKFISKLRFVTIWKKSSTLNRSDLNKDEDYSFNDGAKETYEKILAIVQKQLRKTGNIDTAEVLNNIKKSDYRWARGISRKLFRNEIQASILTNYFRVITNKIKKQTKKTLTTTVALYGTEE